MEKKLEIINVIEYNIIGMKWWLIPFFYMDRDYYCTLGPKRYRKVMAFEKYIVNT